MRIVILSSLYPPIIQGGAEKAAALLAEELARRGDHVAVISLHPGKEKIVEQRNGVRVYRLPIDNFYWPAAAEARPHRALRLLWHLRDVWNWRAARRVGAILDSERPDVMHTHILCGFSIAVWNEARKRGIRVVHTTHDYYLLCLRSDMFSGGQQCGGHCLKCRVGTMGRRYWSNKLDSVISVSKFVLKTHWARGYFGNVHATVGYNISASSAGREPGAMWPGGTGHGGTGPGGTGHSEPGHSETGHGTELAFGFIGRLEEQKGIRTVLLATQLLTAANWRLRIAGSGRRAYVQQLKDEFRDPRIEWLGYTAAAEFYGSVHVVVAASVWSDPLPYVVIEALEHGKALLAARSGGIPEIAALGRVVETFPAGDAAALASAMEQALKDPQRWTKGGFAEASFAGKFLPDVVAGQHRALYEGAEPPVAGSKEPQAPVLVNLKQWS